MKRIAVLIGLVVLLVGVTGVDVMAAGIPAPQPGLVLPINQSPGVWAKCWLFEGRLREKELIVPHPTKPGRMIFVKRPLKSFVISPPMAKPYRGNVLSSAITVPLLLSPRPAQYTLFVLHQNLLGYVIEKEFKTFRTTGYPMNQYYRSGGRKVYADKVLRLRRVKSSERTRFRFHKTFYIGQAIKDALGLP